MPKFKYRALSSVGKVVTGTMEDESAAKVKERLKGNGFKPLKVEKSSFLTALSPRKVKKNKTTSAAVTFPKGAKQQVIAIPASKSFTAKDGAGSDITGTFSSTANVTVTCGGTHTESYKIYVAPANAGLAADSKATITLV